MAEQRLMAEQPQENPTVQHERRDANVGRTLAVLGVFAIFMSLMLFAIWHLWRYAEREQIAAQRMGFPLASHPSQQLPPEPRLEGLGEPDEKRKEIPPAVAVREEQLNRYGKTDDSDFVHIPIARAMEYLVGKLPIRKPTNTDRSADTGLLDAGEPNSGRRLRKGLR